MESFTPQFENKMAAKSLPLDQMKVIIIRKPTISRVIGHRGWIVKTKYRKLWPLNILQVLKLTFYPCFNFKWFHKTET